MAQNNDRGVLASETASLGSAGTKGVGAKTDPSFQLTESASTRTGTFPDYLNALHGDFKTFREGLSSSLASSIDQEASSKVMQSVNGLESKLTVRANELKSACIASITSNMESYLGRGTDETIF